MMFPSPARASAAVPADFPLPSHHPWIRLAGLHTWFRTLDREESLAFHRFLYDVDIDQQTPSEQLYIMPVRTVLVLAVYDMAGRSSRVSFDRLVRWEGIPDEKPFPGPSQLPEAPPLPRRGPSELLPSPADRASSTASSGYDCYRILFRDSAQEDVVRLLGPNPWASSVAAALLSEPGSWAEGRFFVSFGLTPGPAPRGSQAFIQSHIQRAPEGMTIKQLVPLLGGSVRVGATDLAAALSISEQSEAPAVRQVFDLRPKGAVHQMTFAVYGIVGADTKKYPSIAFTPLTSPVLAIMLGVYESVRLDSARFVVTVDKGSGNSVWCAMVSTGTTLSSVDDWYSAPVMSQVDGSDTGVVRGIFEMPPVTMFAREYRASTLGNPPGKFVFAYTGAAETNGTIQGVFTVSVSGQRLMTRVNIGGGNSLNSVRALVSSIHGELEYDVDDIDLAPSSSTGSALVPTEGDEEE